MISVQRLLLCWHAASFTEAGRKYRIVSKEYSFVPRRSFFSSFQPREFLAKTANSPSRPPSKWVGPVRPAPNYNLAPADSSTSVRWLLIDRQINAKTDEQFYHLMRQVVTQDGVQKASRVVIKYDPSHESLTLHWVRILRGTNVLNRLDFSRLQTVQGALDPGTFLFGAKRPSTLLLDDHTRWRYY